VRVKRLGDGVLKVVRGGAGGVELAEQGQGLAAHGLLDERELAHLLCAEGVAQPDGFGVDAAAAASLSEQGAELGRGELGGVAGGGCGGQDGAGFRARDAAFDLGEGGQEAGVVLTQAGPEAVAGLGAVPDRVLLGAGQHRDGLGQLGVGGQRPVHVQVGAQHAGQHERVAVVGLLPRDRVPVPVAGHRHRVDRVDRAAGGAGTRPAARGASRSPPG
jgi:hypothetical protein